MSGVSISDRDVNEAPQVVFAIQLRREVDNKAFLPDFGNQVKRLLKDMGIRDVLTAPRSPWQSPYVERLIGSVRRECLDHIIVVSEESLRRILRSYFDYYHKSRTHLSLGKDAPEPREAQNPELGKVIALPRVGGLHHRNERRGA